MTHSFSERPTDRSTCSSKFNGGGRRFSKLSEGKGREKVQSSKSRSFLGDLKSGKDFLNI